MLHHARPARDMPTMPRHAHETVHADVMPAVPMTYRTCRQSTDHAHDMLTRLRDARHTEDRTRRLAAALPMADDVVRASRTKRWTSALKHVLLDRNANPFGRGHRQRYRKGMLNPPMERRSPSEPPVIGAELTGFYWRRLWHWHIVAIVFLLPFAVMLALHRYLGLSDAVMTAQALGERDSFLL